MCKTCKQLYQSIRKAQRERNAEKARVMLVLLKNHQANTCRECGKR